MARVNVAMTNSGTDSATSARTILGSGRRRLGSRPGRLRIIAILSVCAILAAGVLGFIVASQVISNTNRIEESTGPLLIGTQEMFASLAEADAAATAVYLSGREGDREQRALYERAIDRAGNSLEQVAQLVGDDAESHAAMARITESLTEYTGIVESSRVLNQLGIPGASPELAEAMDELDIASADAQLQQAIQLVRIDIAEDVNFVTDRAQQRLTDEIGAGQFYPAMGLYVLAVIVLVLAMLYLASRFRRILNPPLFLAAMLTLGVAIWFGYSYFNQQASLKNARDGGYESILLTSQIQAKAFAYKADESVGLISGNFVEEARARNALAAEIGDTGGLIFDVEAQADSARERAAAGQLAVRWERYRSTGLLIESALISGQEDEAVRIATGAGNAAFNGFNTAVESVLSDNQAQFAAEVSRADNSLGWLRWVVVVGAVLAALLAWSGFALRIREYQ